MRRYIVALFTALTAVFVAGCGDGLRPVSPTVVSGITRVFMHEPGRFTFIVQHAEADTLTKLGQLRIQVYRNYVTMLEDLKDDEPIRIEYSCGTRHNNPRQCKPIPVGFSNWNLHASQLTIHLHSAQELDGGGWNHGKHGRGQTVVVQ